MLMKMLNQKLYFDSSSIVYLKEYKLDLVFSFGKKKKEKVESTYYENVSKNTNIMLAVASLYKYVIKLFSFCYQASTI